MRVSLAVECWSLGSPKSLKLRVLGLSKGSSMHPQYGPLPPLKDSDVWACNWYRVCKGVHKGYPF